MPMASLCRAQQREDPHFPRPGRGIPKDKTMQFVIGNQVSVGWKLDALITSQESKVDNRKSGRLFQSTEDLDP